MTERIPEETIRKIKESVDLAALFSADGSVLERDGARWKTQCPFHDDAKPSLLLYPNQTFYCWGCGISGDQIRYVRERRGKTFLEAVELLNGADLLAKPAKINKRREYDIIRPIPDGVPRFTGHSRKFGSPVDVRTYRSGLGAPLMYDARYEKRVGDQVEKAVITWCWASNSEGVTQWAMTRPSEELPLYGLDRLYTGPEDATVALFEGAKKSDHAQKLFPAMICSAWCGGSKNCRRPVHDLRPLKDRHVLLFPDWDKSGMWAMFWMAFHIRAAGAASVRLVDLRGCTQPQGWDIADAKDGEGWPERLLSKLVEPDEVDAVLRELVREAPGKLEDRLLAEVLGSLPSKALNPDSSVEPDPGDGGGEPPDDGAADDDGEPAKPDDIERSDIANATRFVLMHKPALRYCPVYGRWHQWDGCVWAPGLTGEKCNAIVMPLAEQTAKAIAAELIEQSKQLFKDAADEDNEWKQKGMRARGARLAAKAEQIQSRKKLLDMVELAKSRAEICVEPAELDAHDHLLTCKNGVVDLSTGKLRTHNPKWLLTQLAPVEFDPAADLTLLMKVVSHVCQHDEDLIAYVQMVLGRSLFANNALEKFYVWSGLGGSGKGTLMEAMKAAVGISCMTAEFQTFVRTQGRQVRDDLARLAEARIVLAAEVEKGESLAAGVLKSITGNDTITSRHLYGTYFEFRPRLSLHLQCNELPRVDDQDSGVWRRLVVIPCGPTLTEAERDPTVKDRLFDPKEGGRAILAWMVAGAVKAAKLRFIPEPEAVRAASAKYRASNNPLKGFLADAVRLADAEHRERTYCLVCDLTAAYHGYCNETFLDRRLRLSERSLGERLEALGCYRKKIRLAEAGNLQTKTYSCWVGITIPDQKLLHLNQGPEKTSFVPPEVEPEETAGAVPVFPSSRGPGKSSPVRGRAGAHPGTPAHTRTQGDTFSNSENRRTEEQPEGPVEGVDLSNLEDT